MNPAMALRDALGDIFLMVAIQTFIFSVGILNAKREIEKWLR